MPKATLTSRVLKNKDTGLEIQVPSYKVKKEVLSSVVHYEVVLASNLACFKLPSHKESDVVQYSVGRRFNEFEDLKSKLQGQFPSTMLPPISKKSIIANDVVLRERRASLDHFMKSVASTPKLATCVPVLEFLGVERLRAKKFNKGEPLDNRASAPADDHSTIGATEGESESTDSIVFGDDEDSGNEDLFGDDSGKDGTDDLFGTDEDSRPGSVKIFQSQDLKRDLTEEDEKDFTTFIPDAILTKTETVRTQEEEDHSELFQIEDDLDKLMTVKTETQKSSGNTSTAASPSSKSQPPKPSSKPTPPTKPSVPSKLKPQIASKPKILTSSQPTDKADIPQKPKPSSSSSSSSLTTKSSSVTTTDNVSKSDPFSLSEAATTTTSIGAVDNLGQDDIMKYLQDNLDSNAEEVDLFS